MISGQLVAHSYSGSIGGIFSEELMFNPLPANQLSILLQYSCIKTLITFTIQGYHICTIQRYR